MLKKTLLAVTVGALVAFGSSDLRAQDMSWRFGVHGAFATDDYAGPGVGAHVEAMLPTIHEQVSAVGSFTYHFPDDPFSYWEINTNGHFGFPLENSTVRPYVGAGINVAHIGVSSSATTGPFGGSVGFSASSTEIGLNVLGGAEFDTGNANPFVQLRLELSGGETVVIAGGVNL